MKKYRNKILFSVGLLAASFLLLAQPAHADSTPLSLINIYPNTYYSDIHRHNIYYYLLKNNQANPVFFEISPLTHGLHVNQRISTCSNGLAAGASCKLVISFDVPNKIGQIQTQLIITTKDKQSIQFPLTYNVPAKPTAIKTIASTSVDHWQATGPYGGQVMDIAISPSDPNHLFAGVYGAGVYKSTDGGKNWTPVNNGMTTLNVQQLLIKGDAIYAVTFDGGIFKSNDDGTHWIAINNGLPFPAYIGVLAADNNTLYASDDVGGIFRSTDGGIHWTTIGNNFPENVNSNAILIKGNVIYAGTEGAGLLKSEDSGKTWAYANNGIGNNVINTLFDDNGILYAGTPNYGATDDSVYKSTDGGQHWTLASNGLGINNITSFAKQGKAIYAGAGSQSVGNGVLISHGGVFKTTDGGRIWTPIARLDYQFVDKVIANNSTLYAATAGGLYQSRNGGSNWTAINNGINGNWITSLLVLPDAIYAGTATSGIFKSTDNGMTWASINAETNLNNSLGIIGITSDNNKNIYVNYISSEITRGQYTLTGIYKSYDGGHSWILLIPPSHGTNPVIPSAMLNQDSAFYIGTVMWGVYQSLDGGASWQQFAPGFPNEQIASMTVLNKMFYVINNGLGIYKTSISGTEQWNSAFGNLPSIQVINGLVPVKNGLLANSLLVLTNLGIYASKDGGQNWLPLNNGLLPYTNVTSLLQLNDTTFIAGTSDGIYKSIDSGQNWWPDSNGLNQIVPINNLVSDGNYEFAGTMAGIYRASLLPKTN